MTIKLDKTNILNSVLYTVLIVYITFQLLDTSFFVQKIPELAFKLVYCIAYLLMILVEIVTFRYTRKEILVIPFLLFLLAISVYTSSLFSNVSSIILFSYFYRKVPFKNVVQVTSITSIIVLIFIIISSLVGVIPDYVFQGVERTRHYLGFRYALFPSIVLLNITICQFFIKKNHVKWTELIFLTFANYWIFNQTDSRLTYYTFFVLLVVWIALKYFPNLLGKIRLALSIFIFSYPVAFLISLWFSFNYSSTNQIHLFLNKFLGERLYLMSKSMRLYGFSLIGQKINWVGNGLNKFGRTSSSSYLYVDNLYIQFLQRYGLIIILAFIIGMTLVMYKLYRRNAMYLYIILISLAFHGMIDDLIGMLHYSIFPIVLGMLYVEYYQLEDNKEEQLLL